MQVRLIPLDQIDHSPHNPRRAFDEAALSSLAASIAEYGVFQPILIRHLPDTERYEIVAGERRWRASRLAQATTIPAIVVELEETTLHELQLLENIEREPLNPIEEAIAFQLLKERFGYSDQALAQRLKRSYGFVRGRLELLTLDPRVQPYVAEGQLTLAVAQELAKIEDREVQYQLAQRAATEEFTAAATASHIAAYRLEQRLRASREGRRLNLLTREEALAATGIVITPESFDPILHHRVWDLRFTRCEGCPDKGKFLRADGHVEDVCVLPECYETLLAEDQRRSRYATIVRREARHRALERVLQGEEVALEHLHYLLWTLIQQMGALADPWRAEQNLPLFGEVPSPDALTWNLIATWTEEKLLTHILRLTVSYLASLSNQSLPQGLRESLAQAFGVPTHLLELEGTP